MRDPALLTAEAIATMLVPGAITVANAPVGARIYFAGEKRGYTIRARDIRFLVCTKPFAARKTVIYSIVDLQRDVRGRHNLIFGWSFVTDEECREALRMLADPAEVMEVSHRRYVPLEIVNICTGSLS